MVSSTEFVASKGQPAINGDLQDVAHGIHQEFDQQLDPPPAVDKAVRSVLRGESRLARRLRLPIGTSLLGVYRRPL